MLSHLCEEEDVCTLTHNLNSDLDWLVALIGPYIHALDIKLCLNRNVDRLSYHFVKCCCLGHR
jgi:hypothetical protein